MLARFRIWFWRVFFVCFIAGGLGCGALAMVAHSDDSKPSGLLEAVAGAPEASGAAPPVEGLTGLTEPGRVNVLVLGVDRRPIEEHDAPARTDTIMVASLDTVGRRASVLSIPRDLLVVIPLAPDRTVLDRINAANVLGDLAQYPGGGVALVRATVKLNMGIRVHHHVVLDFIAFERIIDAIGGVDLDLPEPLVDNSYPTADFRTVQVTLPKGKQHLRGEQALWYARSRSQSSDFSRMQRQQEVLKAVQRRLTQVDTLPLLPTLWSELRGAVETDLTLGETWSLARLALRVPEGGVSARTLDLDFVSRGTVNRDPFLLVPNRSRIAQVVQELFPEEPEVAAPTGMFNEWGP
ncbi:MAG: LytR family transcriptional regulator [Dehalococcoidia bacterium]|nr:LytR family transcriptional regulator [Dehalococcoidia bacterium]